jgi:hypothetical protein
MRVILAFSTALLIAGPAIAGDWVALDGEGIEAALNARSVQYDNATQDFRTSGRTLFDNGRPSWGYWAVRGDQYCSQWPPADGWVCYNVELAADGAAVRFVSETGYAVEGRYRED